MEMRSKVVVTCKGSIEDDDLLYKLTDLLDGLAFLSQTDRGNCHMTDIEPWNSVKVSFNIPKEAAIRLHQLAQYGDDALRNLGVLSVQIDNGEVFDLNSLHQQFIQQPAPPPPAPASQDLELGGMPSRQPLVQNENIVQSIPKQQMQPQQMHSHQMQSQQMQQQMAAPQMTSPQLPSPHLLSPQLPGMSLPVPQQQHTMQQASIQQPLQHSPMSNLHQNILQPGSGQLPSGQQQPLPSPLVQTPQQLSPVQQMQMPPSPMPRNSIPQMQGQPTQFIQPSMHRQIPLHQPGVVSGGQRLPRQQIGSQGGIPSASTFPGVSKPYVPPSPISAVSDIGNIPSGIPYGSGPHAANASKSSAAQNILGASTFSSVYSIALTGPPSAGMPIPSQMLQNLTNLPNSQLMTSSGFPWEVGIKQQMRPTSSTQPWGQMSHYQPGLNFPTNVSGSVSSADPISFPSSQQHLPKPEAPSEKSSKSKSKSEKPKKAKRKKKSSKDKGPNIPLPPPLMPPSNAAPPPPLPPKTSLQDKHTSSDLSSSSPLQPPVPNMPNTNPSSATAPALGTQARFPFGEMQFPRGLQHQVAAGKSGVSLTSPLLVGLLQNDQSSSQILGDGTKGQTAGVSDQIDGSSLKIPPGMVPSSTALHEAINEANLIRSQHSLLNRPPLASPLQQQIQSSGTSNLGISPGLTEKMAGQSFPHLGYFPQNVPNLPPGYVGPHLTRHPVPQTANIPDIFFGNSSTHFRSSGDGTNQLSQLAFQDQPKPPLTPHDQVISNQTPGLPIGAPSPHSNLSRTNVNLMAQSSSSLAQTFDAGGQSRASSIVPVCSHLDMSPQMLAQVGQHSAINQPGPPVPLHSLSQHVPFTQPPQRSSSKKQIVTSQQEPQMSLSHQSPISTQDVHLSVSQQSHLTLQQHPHMTRQPAPGTSLPLQHIPTSHPAKEPVPRNAVSTLPEQVRFTTPQQSYVSLSQAINVSQGGLASSVVTPKSSDNDVSNIAMKDDGEISKEFDEATFLASMTEAERDTFAAAAKIAEEQMNANQRGRIEGDRGGTSSADQEKLENVSASTESLVSTGGEILKGVPHASLQSVVPNASKSPGSDLAQTSKTDPFQLGISKFENVLTSNRLSSGASSMPLTSVVHSQVGPNFSTAFKQTTVNNVTFSTPGRFSVSDMVGKVSLQSQVPGTQKLVPPPYAAPSSSSSLNPSVDSRTSGTSPVTFHPSAQGTEAVKRTTPETKGKESSSNVAEAMINLNKPGSDCGKAQSSKDLTSKSSSFVSSKWPFNVITSPTQNLSVEGLNFMRRLSTLPKETESSSISGQPPVVTPGPREGGNSHGKTDDKPHLKALLNEMAVSSEEQNTATNKGGSSGEVIRTLSPGIPLQRAPSLEEKKSMIEYRMGLSPRSLKDLNTPGRLDAQKQVIGSDLISSSELPRVPTAEELSFNLQQARAQCLTSPPNPAQQRPLDPTLIYGYGVGTGPFPVEGLPFQRSKSSDSGDPYHFDQGKGPTEKETVQDPILPFPAAISQVAISSTKHSRKEGSSKKHKESKSRSKSPKSSSKTHKSDKHSSSHSSSKSRGNSPASQFAGVHEFHPPQGMIPVPGLMKSGSLPFAPNRKTPTPSQELQSPMSPRLPLTSGQHVQSPVYQSSETQKKSPRSGRPVSPFPSASALLTCFAKSAGSSPEYPIQKGVQSPAVHGQPPYHLSSPQNAPTLFAGQSGVKESDPPSGLGLQESTAQNLHSGASMEGSVTSSEFHSPQINPLNSSGTGSVTSSQISNSHFPDMTFPRMPNSSMGNFSQEMSGNSDFGTLHSTSASAVPGYPTKSIPGSHQFQTTKPQVFPHESAFLHARRPSEPMYMQPFQTDPFSQNPSFHLRPGVQQRFPHPGLQQGLRNYPHESQGLPMNMMMGPESQLSEWPCAMPSAPKKRKSKKKSKQEKAETSNPSLTEEKESKFKAPSRVPQPPTNIPHALIPSPGQFQFLSKPEKQVPMHPFVVDHKSLEKSDNDPRINSQRDEDEKNTTTASLLSVPGTSQQSAQNVDLQESSMRVTAPGTSFPSVQNLAQGDRLPPNLTTKQMMLTSQDPLSQMSASFPYPPTTVLSRPQIFTTTQNSQVPLVRSASDLMHPMSLSFSPSVSKHDEEVPLSKSDSSVASAVPKSLNNPVLPRGTPTSVPFVTIPSSSASSSIINANEKASPIVPSEIQQLPVSSSGPEAFSPAVSSSNPYVSSGISEASISTASNVTSVGNCPDASVNTISTTISKEPSRQATDDAKEFQSSMTTVPVTTCFAPSHSTAESFIPDESTKGLMDKSQALTPFTTNFEKVEKGNSDKGPGLQYDPPPLLSVEGGPSVSHHEVSHDEESIPSLVPTKEDFKETPESLLPEAASIVSKNSEVTGSDFHHLSQDCLVATDAGTTVGDESQMPAQFLETGDDDEGMQMKDKTDDRKSPSVEMDDEDEPNTRKRSTRQSRQDMYYGPIPAYKRRKLNQK